MENRRIEFRAWDKENNVMLSHQQLDEFDKDGVMHLMDILKPNNKENVILMQFTGLTDKKGNPIFEGDILGYGDNYACEVKYDSSECQYLAYEYGNEDGTRIHSMTAYTVKWTILGNIYENSDLLTPKSTKK